MAPSTSYAAVMAADRRQTAVAPEFHTLVSELAALLGVEEHLLAIEWRPSAEPAHGSAAGGVVRLQGDPHTAHRRALIAHELAHVRQWQNRNRDGGVGDVAAAEEEAAAIADATDTGKPIWIPHARLPAGTLAHDEGVRGIAPQRHAAPGVRRVIVSRADRVVVFESLARTLRYGLTSYEVEEGIYRARVVVEGNEITFDLEDADATRTRADFGFVVRADQESPITLFGDQETVAVIATNKPVSRLGELDEELPAPTLTSAAIEIDRFRRLVRDAGKARMAANRAALAEWRSFLTFRLTPSQVRDQVVTQELDDLIRRAEHTGHLASADRFMRTSNPYARDYESAIIHGEICPSCHGIMRAEDAERNTPEHEKSGPRWQTPVRQAHEIAAREAVTPSARFTPTVDSATTARGDIARSGMYPGVAEVAGSLDRIRPFLAPLGPSGFRVLPSDVVQSAKSGSALLTDIVRYIEQRRSDYLRFSARIDDPDFDYMMLRPIVDELLPLASPHARRLVERDRADARRAALVEALVVGAATVGTLILAVFPPTSALGVAGLVALETGLAAYSIHSGMASLAQGRLVRLSTGADDVVDRETQEAADTMVAMGYLGIAGGFLGLGAAGLRVTSLGRTAPTGGAAPVIDTVEAEAAGAHVRIAGLAGHEPQMTVTAADGTVLRSGPARAFPTDSGSAPSGAGTRAPTNVAKEQPIPPASGDRTTVVGDPRAGPQARVGGTPITAAAEGPRTGTSRPMLADPTRAPGAGTKPSTTTGAAGPGRPGRGAGKDPRTPFADDPEFARGLDEARYEASRRGAPESLEDLQEGDPRISLRDKPGGAPQAKAFKRGNYVHENAEKFLPESRLPRGLKPEVQLDGGRIRIDRVDFENCVAYEIRPNNPTQIAAMSRQMPGRLRALAAEHPAPPGKVWTWRIVSYDAEDAVRFLLGRGATRKEAQAILEVYGFVFPR